MARIRTVALIASALALAAASACSSSTTEQPSADKTVDYPTRTIQLMAPAAPGGGWDSTARSLQKAIKDANLTSQAVEVTNVAGAAGTIGLAQLVSKGKGDPHQLMVTGLVMVGGVVTNKSAVSLEDTTPIATLTAEAEVIVVKADSPYATLADLATAWKADPGAIKVGGGSAGGTDHILVGLLAKAAGIDPKATKYVPYSGGGETKAALLSGDLGVAVSSVSEFKDLIAAGQLRALGISSATAFDLGGKKIPSLKESGFPLELVNWRGLVAAPGISDAEKAAITALVDKLHASAQWKQTLTDQGWEDFYKTGAEATAFFKSETERITGVLTEIGLVGS